jgi:hypothetical protein
VTPSRRETEIRLAAAWASLEQLADELIASDLDSATCTEILVEASIVLAFARGGMTLPYRPEVPVPVPPGIAARVLALRDDYIFLVRRNDPIH